jgi:hypothetical protein
MSPRLFSRCSKRVERVRTGSTEELGRTIGVFLAASLTNHMCMPSGRCKSVLILWTVGLFDCHSLTFYFWVDIERTRPRRPSGSVDLLSSAGRAANLSGCVGFASAHRRRIFCKLVCHGPTGVISPPRSGGVPGGGSLPVTSMSFLKMEETDDIAFACILRGALLEGAREQHVAEHVLEGFALHFRRKATQHFHDR